MSASHFNLDRGARAPMPLSLVVHATLICGILDMTYAILSTRIQGGTALSVLHSVAAGPFGDNIDRLGWLGGLLGLGVHFAIMAVMVTVFGVVVFRCPRANSNPLASGVVYGVITYLVMYCIVLALRWPANFPQTDLVKIARALFPHVVCVGIPVAYLTRRAMRNAAVNAPERSTTQPF